MYLVYFFILQYQIYREKVTNELAKLSKLNISINSTSFGVITKNKWLPFELFRPGSIKSKMTIRLPRETF